MTLIFFGSDPWFSPPVLGALVKAGHKVPIVVTKGQGLRAKGQRKSIVVQAKTSEDISLETLRSSLSPQPSSFSPSRPDAIILASFGPPFLDDDLLDWPTYGALNVHASLLPRWRGASPVFAAIAAGDKETGVTIMKMTKEIDRGPILGQRVIEIHQPGVEGPGPGGPGLVRPGPASSQGQAFSDDFDTRETLTRKLGVLGGKLIVDVIGRIGHIRPISQTHNSPTPYTYRLKKEGGRIDWTKTPEEIERFIRAVTPWPGAWTEYRAKGQGPKDKGKRIKILTARLEFPQPSALSLQPSLVPDEVQLPGKNPTSWKQFVVGRPGTELR